MTAVPASSGAKCRCSRIGAAAPRRRTFPRCACSFATPRRSTCTTSIARRSASSSSSSPASARLSSTTARATASRRAPCCSSRIRPATGTSPAPWRGHAASRTSRSARRSTSRAGRSRKIIGMAGHSKWANIKHRKAAADSKKGKVFTRLIKEITVAAKAGGGDPDSNPKLRLMLDKARDANMTKDSVTRAIQRGTGELEGTSYEEARYEGYGPGGAAVMVDCLTDNRTRTIAEVRHAFTKAGGNIGADGSVAFQFRHCGQFVFAPGASEEKIMEPAREAGADDVVSNADGSIEVLCAPADFDKVKAAL